jgi:hypothetical protein
MKNSIKSDVNMPKENLNNELDITSDNFCYYSGLPSPLAYTNPKIDAPLFIQIPEESINKSRERIKKEMKEINLKFPKLK